MNTPPRLIPVDLLQHQQALRQCTLCPQMIRPVITGDPVLSPVMSIGQAPGIHEAKVMRPFGWTAGKTLFKWFEGIGLDEEAFRQRVYMSAVCRSLPHPSGLSTWPRTEPGKTLLQDALQAMAAHPAWQRLLETERRE
ncbi:MAG: uracil-DNA glycosylase [Pseudomonadota bacterium]|nr:uracil-DNA glycosylase family protein [Thiothrix fructosivorans]